MRNNLPRVDVSILLFKTKPYLNDFIPSLFKIDYPKGKLRIYVINNESPDDSYEEFQKRCKGKDYFRFLNSGYNLGFAEGHNVTMRVGKGDYVFLLNPDGKILPDTIMKLVRTMEKRKDVGLADGIQMPIVHHKGYDPKSLETSWCSGACMMIRKKALADTGLFDGRFFMYSEDVDLSWRMWSKGWKCITIKDAKVVHYLEGDPRQKHKVGQISLNAFYRIVRNGLFIRYIYGSFADYLRFFITAAMLLSFKDYVISLLKFIVFLPILPFKVLLGKSPTRLKILLKSIVRKPFNLLPLFLKRFIRNIITGLTITTADRRVLVFKAMFEQFIFLQHLMIRKELQMKNPSIKYVGQWENL